jgi:hypothetical protein
MAHPPAVVWEDRVNAHKAADLSPRELEVLKLVVED